MNTIEYVAGGGELLEMIRPLWEQLNRHHARKSPHFATVFERYTFAQRLQRFCDSGAVALRVELARDVSEARLVGYCVSLIHVGGTGEIDSLFVDEAYRGAGIADIFMRSGLAWLKASEARSIDIGVAAGNEEVFGFYARYGFYPRRTILAEKQP